MKQLWSPWRMKYISGTYQPKPGCVFCNAVTEEDGSENLVIHRGRLAFVILNRFPYTSGHLMTVPYEHQPTLADLNAETRSEMMELVNQAIIILGQVYAPQAYNLGANIGAAAGAGIAEHVHLHVVPRWMGDTNFMSTVGEVRVLPEELEETFQRLRAAWRNGQ